MKEYKYPQTKKLLILLKHFYEDYKTIDEQYWKEITKLEKNIEELTGIPDIELFFCDNECVGIGNVSRTMELIRWEKMEE